MRCKVVGISHSSGEFQGKPYDTCRIYGEYELTQENAVGGVGTCAASMNTAAIPRLLGSDFSDAASLSVLIGEVVMYTTNTYGKITDIAVISR